MYPFRAGRRTVNQRQSPFSKAIDKVNWKKFEPNLNVNVTNKTQPTIYRDHGAKKREAKKPKKGKRTSEKGNSCQRIT
jgi:hypothetical protein